MFILFDCLMYISAYFTYCDFFFIKIILYSTINYRLIISFEFCSFNHFLFAFIAYKVSFN